MSWEASSYPCFISNTNDFELNMNLRFKSLANYQKHWLFLCCNKPEEDLALLPWLRRYGIQYQKKEMPWSLRLETRGSIDFCYAPSQGALIMVFCIVFLVLHPLWNQGWTIKAQGKLYSEAKVLPSCASCDTVMMWFKQDMNDMAVFWVWWHSRCLEMSDSPTGILHQITKTESMLNRKQHHS